VLYAGMIQLNENAVAYAEVDFAAHEFDGYTQMINNNVSVFAN
jgi:hypothetical protein